MKIKKVGFLKILYKCLTILLSIYWAIFGFGFACNCVSRVYLYPIKYKEQVLKNATQYGLNALLIFSIIKVESSFNPDAVSSAGAIGLMQITKDTGEYIAKMHGIESYDLLDVNTNISFGCFYLKYLMLKFESLDVSICAYNAGEGNVNSWLNNEKYSKDKKTLFSIPFSETRNYLKKINETFTKYKKLYGKILDK